MKREQVKASTMGSYEQVKVTAACYHDWNPRPAILFGYMHVDAQCTKCKTWWAPPADSEWAPLPEETDPKLEKLSVEIDPSGYYLRWRVVNTAGAMLRRFRTKRAALLYIDALGGDKEAAQRLYRIDVKEASKRMSEQEAWRYAAMGARVMGLTPADVRADPETMAPLPPRITIHLNTV